MEGFLQKKGGSGPFVTWRKRYCKFDPETKMFRHFAGSNSRSELKGQMRVQSVYKLPERRGMRSNRVDLVGLESKNNKIRETIFSVSADSNAEMERWMSVIGNSVETKPIRAHPRFKAFKQTANERLSPREHADSQANQRQKEARESLQREGREKNKAAVKIQALSRGIRCRKWQRQLLDIPRMIAEQALRVAEILAQGIEVREFLDDLEPRIRILYLHEDGSIVLSQTKADIDAETPNRKAIPLYKLHLLRDIAPFPVFQSHKNYVTGKEEQCLVIREANKVTSPNNRLTFYIQLPSVYVRDILYRKLQLVASSIRILGNSQELAMAQESGKFALSGWSYSVKSYSSLLSKKEEVVPHIFFTLLDWAQYISNMFVVFVSEMCVRPAACR